VRTSAVTIFCTSTSNSRFFGRPFVKQFTLCYRTVGCLSICLWRWCFVAKPLDRSTWNLACNLTQCGQCGRWGLSSLFRGGRAPIFGPCLFWPNGRPSQLLLNICFNWRKLKSRFCITKPAIFIIKRDGDFWRLFCLLYLQRAACSAFQTYILNSH